MVAEVHKNGMLVKPWTVNRLNIVEQIYAWGVDGIITDCESSLVGGCIRGLDLAWFVQTQRSCGVGRF
jgi:hypothetical protein